MKRFRSKKAITVLVAGAITLGGAGAALAYFTSTGAGTGSASVGAAGSWTVNQVSALPANSLYPDAAPGGANIETVTYNVTNGGSGTQNLASVSVAVDPTYSFVDGNSDPACTAADFSLDGGTVGTSASDAGLAGPVAAGSYDGQLDVHHRADRQRREPGQLREPEHSFGLLRQLIQHRWWRAELSAGPSLPSLPITEGSARSLGFGHSPL